MAFQQIVNRYLIVRNRRKINPHKLIFGSAVRAFYLISNSFQGNFAVSGNAEKVIFLPVFG